MKLVLRKVQYAPEVDGPGEAVIRSQDFITPDNPLHLEATLEKEVSSTRTRAFWVFCPPLQNAP